jgi:hypothetical protein
MATRLIKSSRLTTSIHKFAYAPLISRSTAVIPHSQLTYRPSTRNFSISKPAMAETKSTNCNAFFEAVKNRHTYYALNKDVPISDARILEIVKEAILNVPSPFNSQSARLVVLLGKEHEDFWDIIMGVLEGVTPKDHIEGTRQKIAGFKAAYGSVSAHPRSRAFTRR